MGAVWRRTRLWAAVLTLCELASSPSARADVQQAAPPWVLELSAPPQGGCSETADLQARVERRVGAERKAPGMPRVRVELHQERVAGGWSARVLALSADGRATGVRELRSREEDCQALDIALVLVISAVLGVERSAPLERDEPVPEQPPEKPAPVAYQVEKAPRSGAVFFSVPQVESPAEPWRVAVGASARAVTGLVPGAAAAVGAGLNAHSGRLQLIAGALFVPQSRIGVGAAAQSSFAVALGELSACAIAARPADGTVAFCAGAQAGAIWSQPRGLWMQRNSQQFVVLAVPSFRTLLPIADWLAVQGGLGASFPLRSAVYSYIDDAGERRRVHGVQMGLWAELGAALRFSR